MQKGVTIGLISASLLVFILGAGFVFYLVQFFRRKLLARASSKWWILAVSGIWIVTVAIIIVAWIAALGRLFNHADAAATGFFLSGFLLTIVISLFTIYCLPQYAVGFDDEYLYLLGEKIELALLTNIEQRGHFVILWYKTNRKRRQKLRWIKNCATTKFILKYQNQIVVDNPAPHASPEKKKITDAPAAGEAGITK